MSGLDLWDPKDRNQPSHHVLDVSRSFLSLHSFRSASSFCSISSLVDIAILANVPSTLSFSSRLGPPSRSEIVHKQTDAVAPAKIVSIWPVGFAFARR